MRPRGGGSRRRLIRFSSASTAYRLDSKGRGRLLATAATGPPAEDLSWSADYALGGRIWRLVLTPTQDFFTAQRSWLAWGALVSGLAFTSLLGVFLLKDSAAIDGIRLYNTWAGQTHKT